MLHFPGLRSRGHVLPALTVFLAVIIFIFDTLTGIGVAAAVFYTVVVLLAVRFLAKREVITVSCGCLILTLIGSIISASGELEIELVNTAISMIAIVATTYLVLEIEASKTAVEEANAKLAHVARVTALGELAASIAHEVNQPLAAIVMNGNACLRWLSARPRKIDEAKRAAQNIVGDADKAALIIARIRALTKRSERVTIRVDLNEVANEVLSLTASEMRKEKIALETEFSQHLPAVRGDRIQLQQLVLNLVLNAIEALREVPVGQRALYVGSFYDEPGFVLLTVCDTGGGLKVEDATQIFEPFFTTKKSGLGMGLAVSRSIVEAHEGKIWAAPNTNRGTMFRVLLPIEADVTGFPGRARDNLFDAK